MSEENAKIEENNNEEVIEEVKTQGENDNTTETDLNGESSKEQESNSDDSSKYEDIEDGKIPPDIQPKVNDIVKRERLREREKLESKMQVLQQKVDEYDAQRGGAYQDAYGLDEGTQDNIVQDKLTGKYYSKDSIDGRLILREQEIEGYKRKLNQDKEEVKQQQKLEELESKFTEASLKYSDFDSSTNSFGKAVSASGSLEAAEGLMDVKNPAAIINYFGKSPEELSKFSKMSSKEQLKMVYRLEDRLSPTKKTTSNAPPPANGVNSSANQAGSSRQLTIDERTAQIRTQQKRGK